ncbi:hypothetical protein, partial [Actinoplanes sp. NPDC089786]|uniref:hypothetical protein n=1 Tax=Actinoplanes sp. NPDC089786 TaxID=3155185 RepID=UPI00341B44B3
CQRNREAKQNLAINWHWLIKHPVEFSKNNHTPRTGSLTEILPWGFRSDSWSTSPSRGCNLEGIAQFNPR